MSGAHRVSLDDLDNLIARMASFERSFADAYEQVDAQANELHATWAGAAADEHTAAHVRWRAGVRQMHEALVTMRSIAGTAQSNYQAAASANTRMWLL